jgi:hypothetical protein
MPTGFPKCQHFQKAKNENSKTERENHIKALRHTQPLLSLYQTMATCFGLLGPSSGQYRYYIGYKVMYDEEQ